MFLLSKSSFLWNDIPEKTTFAQIHLSETFVSRFKFSIVFSAIATLPTFSYQLYLFCLPAMFKKESLWFKKNLLFFNIIIISAAFLTYFLIFPFYVYSSLEVTKLMLPLNTDSLIPFQISLRIDDLIMQFIYCFVSTIFIVIISFFYYTNITDKLFALTMINRISFYTRLIFFWITTIFCFSLDMISYAAFSFALTSMWYESNIVVKIMI